MRVDLRTTRYAGDAAAAVQQCLTYKGSTSISVVIPALEEEDTVAGVVRPIVELVDEGLVDDVVVIDGGSTDRTVACATEAGARVVLLGDHLPLEPHPGKGGALWLSVAETSGDLLLFLDADVAPFDADWVAAKVEPLLSDHYLQLVKGCYDRPVGAPGAVQPGRGGRVTELVARPLLAAAWPELAQVRQPLAGETAGRRSLLESLPFATGYGVEIGLLLDTCARHGIDAIAQVDLGERWHKPQHDDALARMAATVLHAALRRLPAPVTPDPVLWQYDRSDSVVRASSYDVPSMDLPARVQ
jgi:glucosyl-3-phosphoglycerate synthase